MCVPTNIGLDAFIMAYIAIENRLIEGMYLSSMVNHTPVITYHQNAEIKDEYNISMFVHILAAKSCTPLLAMFCCNLSFR